MSCYRDIIVIAIFQNKIRKFILFVNLVFYSSDVTNRFQNLSRPRPCKTALAQYDKPLTARDYSRNRV